MSQVMQPDVFIVFNDGKMDDMLVQLSGMIGKPIGQIIQERSVMMARYMADNTAPIAHQQGPTLKGQSLEVDGDSSKAQKLQQFAIRRDMKRTYIGARAIFQRLKDSNGEAGKAQAGQFWKSIKAGNITEARDIMRSSGIKDKDAPLIQFDRGEAWKKGRTRQGKVNAGRKPTVVIDMVSLKRYAKNIEKRAGFTKAGWINAAAKISTVGLTRVKGWIKIHTNSPGYAEDRTSNTAFPAVYLTNSVPWINIAMRPGAITYAERAFLQSLAESIDRQLTKIIAKTEGKSK